MSNSLNFGHLAPKLISNQWFRLINVRNYNLFLLQVDPNPLRVDIDVSHYKVHKMYIIYVFGTLLSYNLTFESEFHTN